MIDAAALHEKLQAVIEHVQSEADAQMARWQSQLVRSEFAESALNLAYYLALRHHDLRPLQRLLMALGLSLLGRLESRVLRVLTSVKASLAALCGRPAEQRPSAEQSFAGEERLAANTRAVLGPCSKARPIALLVTCPSEAADDPNFMLELAERGVEAVRINCAHDDAESWARMISHLRAAEKATGTTMKILMDLAGPKIRTGTVRAPDDEEPRAGIGDLLVITAPGGLDRIELHEKYFGAESTLPEATTRAAVGQRVFVDDGKLGAHIERVEPWGLVARAFSQAGRG